MPTIIDLPEDEGPTKRDIIDYAMLECGRAGYEFDTTPEQLDVAMRRLNAMMAEWKAARGLDLGYDLTADDVLNPSALSGIPAWTMEAVATSLAMRLAPTMGKTMSPEARAAYSASMARLQAFYATVPSAVIPAGVAMGAGLGSYFYRRFSTGTD